MDIFVIFTLVSDTFSVGNRYLEIYLFKFLHLVLTYTKLNTFLLKHPQVTNHLYGKQDKYLKLHGYRFGNDQLSPLIRDVLHFLSCINDLRKPIKYVMEAILF